MVEEKPNNSFKWLGWILFLILLGFVAGIYLSPSVSGFDWPFGKTNYCLFSNYSNQSDCDLNWCNNVLTNESQVCAFDINEYLCKCTFANPIISNETNQTWITLSSDYYTKSEVENITLGLRIYIENLTRTLRDSMLDRLDNSSAPIYYGSDEQTQGSTYPWFVWPFVAAIIMAGLIFISQSRKNERQPIEASRKRIIIPSQSVKRPYDMANKKKEEQRQEEEI